jgi:hypothetical protein
MIGLSLAFNYIGLAAFAAAMESHGRTFPRASSRIPRASLVAIGGIFQAGAVAFALAKLGIAAGPVLWVVGWAIGGLVLSLLLAFRPRFWPLPAIIFLLLSATDWLDLV